jgi:hypothetical protein
VAVRLPELPIRGGLVRDELKVPVGSPCPAATRPRAPWPWLPGSSPACSNPTTSSSSPPAVPPEPEGAQAPPAGCRGDGRDVPVRRGRRPPAYTRDRTEPRVGRR